MSTVVGRALAASSASPTPRRSRSKAGKDLSRCPHVLQEAEAISRYSKLCWAAEVGREPVSLQHDGVLLRLWPHDSAAEVEGELSRLCSAALGYEQPVAHKS